MTGLIFHYQLLSEKLRQNQAAQYKCTAASQQHSRCVNFCEQKIVLPSSIAALPCRSLFINGLWLTLQQPGQTSTHRCDIGGRDFSEFSPHQPVIERKELETYH